MSDSTAKHLVPALAGTAVVSIALSYGLFVLTVGRIMHPGSSRPTPEQKTAPKTSIQPAAHTLGDHGTNRLPSRTAATATRPYNFVQLVHRVGPTVVHIATVKDFASSPLYHWMPRGRHRATSLGTGFIVRSDGLILTNNHVIHGADVIMVRLADDQEFRAKVVGADPGTDIALITINAKKPLPVAKLGDSDALQIGEPVVAIGNPFGLDHTVTAGIVSAKGRHNIAPGGKRSPYWNFIQTDASINPGNSGGPLINMHGEVVGINSAIDSRGAGIGFAIPINMAKVIMPLLEKHGRAPRSYLGVSIQPVTPSLQASLGLRSRKGALVSQVVSGSPAARAGILPGDVIIEFNGKPVEKADNLPWMAAIAGIGKTVPIVILRGTKKVTVRTVMAALNPLDQPGHKTRHLGLTMTPMTPQMARLYGVPAGVGLVITSVQRNSPAHLAGLARGEVVLQVGDRPVGTPADFVRTLNRYRRGTDVPLLVTSPRGTRWILVPNR
ncbi:MAG: trypsin-like peptidase domain-containing protein [Deltaproteobacteria bacterium]|nr:trypsin-like peptidase domain-containing protein [Deltaproteobacteria bacterium]